MKLYIDTSNSQKITIGLNDENFTFPSKKEKSQILLPKIISFLNKQYLTLKDIKEIEINQGPGSFTGLRVGLSVANTIGWALNIPVNGKNISKEGPLEPIYE
jgi:tRNA threonylcarbamoyladenosine biosynthesis protein TsaB